MNGMTPQMRDAYHAILCLTDGAVPPTYQRIADEMGVAKSRAWVAVRRLEERGYVRTAPGRKYSIEITGKGIGDDVLRGWATERLVALRDRINDILEGRKS